MRLPSFLPSHVIQNSIKLLHDSPRLEAVAYRDPMMLTLLSPLSLPHYYRAHYVLIFDEEELVLRLPFIYYITPCVYLLSTDSIGNLLHVCESQK